MAQERPETAVDIKSGIPFVVGEWRVEPALNKIRHEDMSARLEPRVMELLVCLAARAGEPISRQELLESVWADAAVGDEALTMSISKLRRALGDSPRSPRLIETVAKRGYRLMVPVEPIEPTEPPAAGRGRGEGEATPPAGESGPAAPTPARSEGVEGQMGASWPWLDGGSRGWGLLALVALVVVWWVVASRGGGPAMEDTPPRSSTPDRSAALGRDSTLARDSTPALRHQRLTSAPGAESQAELSPDGGRVAYVRQGPDEARPGLHVQAVGGGEALWLAEAGVSSPSWSREGQRIAYVQHEPAGAELRLISADGGVPRILMAFESCPLVGIDWSPDGRWIVLALPTPDHQACALFAIDADSGARHQLTRPEPGSFDARPVYSPDGAQIAFSRGPNPLSHDLFVMPAEGGEARQLTHDAQRIWGFDWAGDARSLVMASNRGGPFQLWRVGPDGAEPTWIPVVAEEVRFPSVRGRQLVFDEYRITAGLWRLDPGGTASQIESLTSNRRDSTPRLSPDGQRLAFVSNRSGHAELWLSERFGEPRRLTSLEASFILRPEWSPDGRSLVFTAILGPLHSIYRLALDEGEGQEVVEAGTEEVRPAHPSWSHDGRAIYSGREQDGSWDLWRLPVVEGEATRVVEGGVFGLESPGGGALYYVRDQAVGIWRRPVGGGIPTLVIEDLVPHWGTSWLIRDGGLYYLRSKTQGPELVRWDLDAGASVVVAKLPNGMLGSALSVSPLDGSILFDRYEGTESDLRLISDFE